MIKITVMRQVSIKKSLYFDAFDNIKRTLFHNKRNIYDLPFIHFLPIIIQILTSGE